MKTTIRSPFRHMPTLIMSASIMFALFGCAVAPLVGEIPSDTPPRLVKISVPKGNAGVSGDLLTWDRPFAFGRIPKEMQSIGDIACMKSRIDLEAVGYHPRAQNKDGQSLVGGGFFCGPKLHGDKPAQLPPRLVRRDGILGWDRPSAFGAVPAEREIAGQQVCGSISPKFKAIGFHPNALSELGRPIPGGGFFCVEQ